MAQLDPTIRGDQLEESKERCATGLMSPTLLLPSTPCEIALDGCITGESHWVFPLFF